jgi:mono/diheme cytochrome c family protein
MNVKGHGSMTRFSLKSLGLVAGFLFAGGYVLASGSNSGLLPYTDQEVIESGRTLYDQNCASCHGADLSGAPDWRTPDADGFFPAPPHDQTGHTWHHPDAQLIDITTRGTAAIVGNGYQSRMIGFADILTQEEIIATLAYIKSTWPQRVIEAHNKINSAGN